MLKNPELKEAVVGLYRKLIRLWIVNRLSSSKIQVLKSLANVIDETLGNKISREERVWINKIEDLKKKLNASSAEISIVDYGKVSPDSDINLEEMYRGKVINKTIGEVCQTTSVSYPWTLLLFKLIREFRPSICLELGTSLGISAAYQAAALELNKQGKIVTLEGAESLVSLARENFKKISLNRVHIRTGRFQDILEKVLIEQGNIDFAFIDGHHDKDATLIYFEKIVPFLSDFAIAVLDDISWSKGMKEAWNIIRVDERVKVSVKLGNLGIIIISRLVDKKENYNFYLI